MKHWVGYRKVLSVLLMSLAVACGGSETPENAKTATTAGGNPEPVEKLVIDMPVFNPEAYYTFDNPGGWSTYQKLNLTDPTGTIKVAVLTSPDKGLSFEEYVQTWTQEEAKVLETENGWKYTIMQIAETPSIFIESPDGIHWLFQIQKRVDDADAQSFVDTVLKIALSATYIPRDAKE